MIPELGHFALILALLLSSAQAFFSFGGAARGTEVWMAAGRSAVVGQFVFIAVAFGALAWSFVEGDFSVLYVASNSHSELPLFYLPVLLLLGTIAWILTRKTPKPGHCRKCGYDLTGNVSGRCPECGAKIAAGRKM